MIRCRGRYDEISLGETSLEDIAEKKCCAMVTLNGEMSIGGNISGGFVMRGMLCHLAAISWRETLLEDATWGVKWQCCGGDVDRGTRSRVKCCGGKKCFVA